MMRQRHFKEGGQWQSVSMVLHDSLQESTTNRSIAERQLSNACEFFLKNAHDNDALMIVLMMKLNF